MNPIARTLIIGGAILIVIGVLWQFGGRFLPLGRLPGDFAIHRGGAHFYFPLASSLVLSILLSLLLYIVRLIGR